MLRSDPEQEEREWKQSFVFLPQPPPLLDLGNDVDPFDTKAPTTVEEGRGGIQCVLHNLGFFFLTSRMIETRRRLLQVASEVFQRSV